ncbi:MAG TPA: helix-turn-helix domain-containing protein [Rhizomicrobium sp.]|nr:helix-turn-helix domain-containing protein [Rhizomicrobium sp.]
MERGAALAKGGGILDAGDIDLKSVARATGNWTDQIPLGDGWKANVAAVEKAMVARPLRMAAGKKSRAAESLGIHRRLLYEKMREHGVEG